MLFETRGIIFHQIKSEVYQFTGTLLLFGYRKVPKERDHWSSQIDLNVLFIADAMARNRYLLKKQCLHVAENRNHVEGSKIAKVEPLYSAFNMTLKQFGILHDKLSIDKTMAP